jgi:hypothetical protein
MVFCPSSAPPPNHLVPVFSCEKALNIKKIKIKIEGLGIGWEVLTYGIFARVNLFSQNERARVQRASDNKCENTIQKHFPLLNLFIL